MTLKDLQKTYIIAEMSANHNGSFDKAKEIIKAAKDAGADAIKLQTYKPETITLNSSNAEFMIKGGLWDGYRLFDLYAEAMTPWEWHEPLMKYANELGLDCFSSPFDKSAVDLMESLDMPAFKIASFEITDINLIKECAKHGKPVIISTGCAHLGDIDRAVEACHSVGNDQIALLKCTSSYPSPYEDINLRALESLKRTFGCVVGLSDHTFGYEVALGAVALGAKIIEKHFIIKRSDGGPDSGFSMEASEFSKMCEKIRNLEKALGSEKYELTPKQKGARSFSRSLYVCKDMKKGEVFSLENIQSVRPANGLQPRFLGEILGKKARCDISFATPLSWDLIE